MAPSVRASTGIVLSSASAVSGLPEIAVRYCPEINATSRVVVVGKNEPMVHLLL